MKPALIVAIFLCLAALTTGVAFADPPDGRAPGRDAEPCHGSNDDDCRSDPQPTRGRDCENSDDHTCGSTRSRSNPRPTVNRDEPVESEDSASPVTVIEVIEVSPAPELPPPAPSQEVLAVRGLPVTGSTSTMPSGAVLALAAIVSGMGSLLIWVALRISRRVDEALQPD